MKKTTIVSLMILVLPLLQGCFGFYTNKSVKSERLTQYYYGPAPDWQQFLIDHSQKRPIILLYTPEEVLLVKGWTFEGNMLKGSLTPVAKSFQSFVPESKKVFSRTKIPKELRREMLATLSLETDLPLQEGVAEIPVDHLSEAQFFTRNWGLNVLANAPTAIVGATAVGAGILAIACNCPRVYSFDKNGRQLQGSFISGAIAKSLEREDYLPLDLNLQPGEPIRLQIANELPEYEYINSVQLYKAKIADKETVGILTHSGLYAFEELIAPFSAKNILNQDVFAEVNTEDEKSFQFDEKTLLDSLNTLHLSFRKDQLGKKPVLVVKGRQTEWLEMVAEAFFGLLGNKFDKWTARMDKADPEKYAANASRRGISMNAWLKTNQGWEMIGTFHNAGVIKEKILGLPIDLSEVVGENIEIKLESAYRLWDINQVGISPNWREIDDFVPIPMISAINEKGEKINELIHTHDEQYAIQPDSGSFMDVLFTNDLEPGEKVFLKGGGYYYHNRQLDQPINRKALISLRKPISTHHFSQAIESIYATHQRSDIAAPIQHVNK
ncbi:MAG: hypothetical protein AAF206_12955 [Bacteroidota bacterium]